MTAVCCVASGPSFTEAQAELIRTAHAAGKCALLVVNRMWERFPDADVLYAADAKWWREYWPRVQHGFNGECWTADANVAREFGLCPIKVDGRGQGLSRDPAVIFSAINSGYQAIGLAYHFGATQMILVGYDMQHTGGRRHSHPDYPTPKFTNANGVASWAPAFTQLGRDLNAAGVRTVNCTISTALDPDAWPRADLADTLAAL